MKTSKITTTLLILAIAGLLSLTGCSIVLDWPEEDTSQPVTMADNQLRVIFLDVGQGASQLIITPSGKTMLVDAGNNDKEQKMLEYMEQYHITKLDVVIGTHPDADHIGGMDKIIDYMDVAQIYMPKAQANTKTFESVLQSVKNKNLKIKTAKGGLAWNLDDEVHVRMVAPQKTYQDSNNMSAVIKITYGNTSFLLTGDAEAESEKDMQKTGEDLHADVLLVGHHGSNSSTTLSFLKSVNPRYAVIQVGADNKYGHPKNEILNRLQKQGVAVYRNDLMGTVEIDSDGENLNIHTER